MKQIRVAIAGVGNCASSLVQGIKHYKSLSRESREKNLGLMHYDLGGYKPEDIKFVAAFDIDRRKVGRPLEEAIFARPNCTKKIADVFNDFEVMVEMGPKLDSIASHMKAYPENQRFIIAKRRPVDVCKALKKGGTEILLVYLPVGSEKAVKHYAEACLKAGVSLINCIPVFVASDPVWSRRFGEKNIPIIGDDIKSQIGATIIHRALAKLFEDRGVKIENTYQLNVGGNTDFLNMLSRKRLSQKKISKTEAVQSQTKIPLGSDNIHIGPSDYVPWLKDNKICFLRMEGRIFGNIPISLEARLSVEDSPNSAGIVIDAIRCAKLALDRGEGGSIEYASSYFMKHPLVQHDDNIARYKLEKWIRKG